MRTVIAIMLALSIFDTHVTQYKLTNVDLMKIGNIVAGFRQQVLSDSTRIDFCAIDEFWDAKGNLLLGANGDSFNRYPNRSKCPVSPEEQDESDYRNVMIHNLRMYPDSVVLLGSSKKPNTTIFETYWFGLGKDGINDARYMVFAFSQDQRRR